MLKREQEQMQAAERAARGVAEERQRAVQYAQAEKLGLTHVLQDQDNTVKILQKDLEEVRPWLSLWSIKLLLEVSVNTRPTGLCKRPTLSY